jgi:hypothetical protein
MNFFSLLSSSDYNWALRSVIFGAFFYWGNVTFGAFYLGGLRRLPNSPKGRAGTASGRDRIGSCGYLSQIQCHVIPVKNDNKRMSLKFNDSGQYKCWTQAWPWLTELQCARIKNQKVERKIEDEMHVENEWFQLIFCVNDTKNPIFIQV